MDELSRLLGSKLSELLGQQFIVENKPGASGSMGTAFAAKSPPDGYTFVVVFDTHAVNPTLIPNLCVTGVILGDTNQFSAMYVPGEPMIGAQCRHLRASVHSVARGCATMADQTRQEATWVTQRS